MSETRTPADVPIPTAESGLQKLDLEMREAFVAMVADMKNPAIGACWCGFPNQPCLRILLRNGPPFPPRPCEPKR